MKDIKIATSYFYQIRNFLPNFIPVSTCLSDPQWYRPGDKEYYIDKRGVVCGLRYEPLIVQGMGHHSCPCEHPSNSPYCPTMVEYRELLETVDFDKMIKAFKFCCNKFNCDTIVLMVYEAPNNLCSERWPLQNYFKSHGYDCEELKYPIKENYR